MIAFGPVPSRRLGFSLGVNHIPPKTCTYACVYCQVGRTTDMRIEPRAFFSPDEVIAAVEAKLHEAREGGQPMDYCTFVPDGEPTLDIHLGELIAAVRALGPRVAVISNASLMDRAVVREALLEADWVSLKADAATPAVWHRIDRPHGRLDLDAIQVGMLAFAQTYRGELVTETMLVAGMNDGDEELAHIASLIARLQPATAYLSIPIRPPAVSGIAAPGEARVHRAYQILSRQVARVEYLIGYEGNAFAASGDARDDLLSITAVHPMRQDAVEALLARDGAGWDTVEAMIASGDLVAMPYEGSRFYLRRF